MKNINEILTALGIQIPEDKKADFDKEFAENYKTVADYNKQKLKLDQAQESLQLAQDGLKKFDGVDVAALQNQITQLQNDIAAKETAHAKELADRDFTAMLDAAIAGKHGRSAACCLLACRQKTTSKIGKEVFIYGKYDCFGKTVRTHAGRSLQECIPDRKAGRRSRAGAAPSLSRCSLMPISCWRFR